MKENNICVFLKIEDKPLCHSDIFDHPDYEYTCMLTNKKSSYLIFTAKNAKKEK